MPLDLTPHIDPATSAVVTLEVQENLLLPDRALIPGLAAHAQEVGLIDRLATLFDAARRVGVRVLYVTDDRRHVAAPPPSNAFLGVGRAMRPAKDRPRGHGPIVAELTPHTEDIAMTREHGMTGFYTTPLDAYLRSFGIKTVVLTGVSANIAVNGTAIEAMNRGYRVVVPSDCIAGDPPSYVEQLLRFTIRNVALVGPVQGILDHWNSLPANPLVVASR
jgi:nicotinamidase-related amidase